MDVITLYRIANWCYRHRIPLLPKLIQAAIFVLFNSYVPYQATIGKGSRLGHRGIGVVINREAVIGDNVLIRAHATIGKKHPDGKAPRIGNHVEIGDGAKIIGDLDIGDRAIIGANAVVVKNVEPNAIVGGVPAKVIGTVMDD